MSPRTALIAPIAALLLAGAAPTAASAQSTGPLSGAWTLAGGAMSFDASGTGTAPMATLSEHQTLPWRWVAVENTLGYARLDEQFMTTPTHLGILEAQLQFQLPSSRLQPYLGVGPGIVSYFSNRGGRKMVESAVNFGAGLRVALSPAWALRLDGRIRGWGFGGGSDWASNTSGDLTLGISRGF